MKKLLLILVAFVCCLSLFTQDALLIYRQNYAKPLLVALKDITSITYEDAEQVMSLEEWNITSESETAIIDSIVFVDLETLPTEEYAYFVCPDDHHPHMIDLGLPSGVLWSCCNVGATAPEEYGGYYAWGETEEKDVYGWVAYQYYDSITSRIKYIGDDIAGTELDVAHVKWGGSWRMPKSDHFKELIDNCTYVWTQLNGVDGALVTGPNGSTIFLPAAGDIGYDTVVGEGKYGYYWSSSHYPGQGERYSYFLLFSSYSSYNWGMNYKQRCVGYSVRPIITPKETKDECPVAEAVDLGLPSGTLWASWNIGASAPEEYGGYYAWGETKEKDYYSWSNYIHCDGSNETCYHIGDDIAGTEYDVAHVKWGGSWTMPTSVQIYELTSICTSTWTQMNGVNGLLVTGPNGNTIFLPAAGYKEKENISLKKRFGQYWSSTLNSTSENGVWGLGIGSDEFGLFNYLNFRYAGFSVRAVI